MNAASPAALRIVASTRRHEAQIGALIVGIQRKEFGIDIDLAEQPDLTDIDAFYRRGNGNFWVALDGDAVVGTIALADIGHGNLALRKMFVAAPYRGAPHHAAARLLDAALAWARARNVTAIYLGTTEQFAGAHRFYAKHGFEAIAKDALPEGFWFMRQDTRFFRMTLKDDGV